MTPSPSATLRAALALFLFLAAAAVAGLSSPARAIEAESPSGRWQTFDDATHAPRGIVHIFEKDGLWFGRIEPRGRTERCVVCSDERHDQPIDGLLIIRNMQRAVGDAAAWEGGDVLDPDTGRIYRFRMRLEDGGSRLMVRGYFGVSALGRTQTWSRLR